MKTRTVVRGDYVFAISLEQDRRAEHITVSRAGCVLAAGRLDLFSPDYMATWRYRQAFHRASPKPVGRVGELLIGPDAAAELSAALESMRREAARAPAKPVDARGRRA